MVLVTHNLAVVAEMCDRVHGDVRRPAGRGGDVYDALRTAAAPVHPAAAQGDPGFPHDGQRLYAMRGSVPGLDGPITGCAFAARCDSLLGPQCHATAPALVADDAGGLAACHRVGRTSRSSCKGECLMPSGTQNDRRPGGRRPGSEAHFPVGGGLLSRFTGGRRSCTPSTGSTWRSPGQTLGGDRRERFGQVHVGPDHPAPAGADLGHDRFRGQDVTRRGANRCAGNGARCRWCSRTRTASVNRRKTG